MKAELKWYLKIFFIAFPILIALDVSWVGVIANGFYKANVGDLFSATPNYYAALAFYVFYTIGLMYFALIPAFKEQSFVTAFIRAGALGFVGYMLYNTTNMAVLTHWSLLVTVVDTTWGIVLSSVTAGLTYILAEKLYGIGNSTMPHSPEEGLI